ncbi:hypothetical protein F5Y17DRAFT_126660 [Xylariaceae sp. FL0594]|nr:hypothetical protein F5Y17DRAFT_126660 [Xylariaceae sp. FL0594]
MEAAEDTAPHRDERSTPAAAADAMEGVEASGAPDTALDRSNEGEKETTAFSKDGSAISLRSSSNSETPAPAPAPAHADDPADDPAHGPANGTAPASVPSREPTSEPAQSVMSPTVSQQQRLKPAATMGNVEAKTPAQSRSPTVFQRQQVQPAATMDGSVDVKTTPAWSPPPQAMPQRTPTHRPHQEANGTMIRFASPDNDHQARVPRFKRDLSLVADAVQQACPEAVRRVVRDKWEKCIMGSEFHHAFLLNATIHHASGVIMRRAVRDFGKNLVTEAKAEIANHMTKEDIDAISEVLLEKCSDEFLDKALERRLRTIDARPLINALARAERLGYTTSDILEDKGKQEDDVMQAAPIPEMNAFPSFPSSLPTEPLRAPLELQCKQCWRKFTDTAPYEFHVKKQLCLSESAEKTSYVAVCEHCGAKFTTKPGKQYHQANAVCGAHAMARATPKNGQSSVIEWPPALQTSSQPSILRSNSFIPPPSQPYSTPRPSRVEPSSTPGSQDDPYAHLSVRQRAMLEEDLRVAEQAFIPRFREAEAIKDPKERQLKETSLQNTFSTKQSMIRKKYGVRLRQRRTRQEIEEERIRMGLSKHSLADSPDPALEGPSKRRRNDDYLLQQHSLSPVPQQQQQQPSNHLTVSEMGSGLGGSMATAATTDPTTSSAQQEQQAPRNSLSSLQRKGYRVSSHVAAKPVQSSSSSSSSEDDDDDDDSGTDGDIPAVLPSARKGT